MKYEAEIGGKVVKRMDRYESLMVWISENTDQPFQIFTYKPSKMNSKKLKVSDSDMLEVIELRGKGWTWVAIAKYLGWSQKILQIKMKKEYGIAARPMGIMNDEKREQALERYINGESIYKIAKDMGVVYSTIWRAVNNSILKVTG